MPALERKQALVEGQTAKAGFHSAFAPDFGSDRNPAPAISRRPPCRMSRRSPADMVTAGRLWRKTVEIKASFAEEGFGEAAPYKRFPPLRTRSRPYFRQSEGRGFPAAACKKVRCPYFPHSSIQGNIYKILIPCCLKKRYKCRPEYAIL